MTVLRGTSWLARWGVDGHDAAEKKVEANTEREGEGENISLTCGVHHFFLFRPSRLDMWVSH